MFNDDEISHNMGNEAIRGYTEVVRIFFFFLTFRSRTISQTEVGL